MSKKKPTKRHRCKPCLEPHYCGRQHADTLPTDRMSSYIYHKGQDGEIYIHSKSVYMMLLTTGLKHLAHAFMDSAAKVWEDERRKKV